MGEGGLGCGRVWQGGVGWTRAGLGWGRVGLGWFRVGQGGRGWVKVGEGGVRVYLESELEGLLLESRVEIGRRAFPALSSSRRGRLIPFDGLRELGGGGGAS